MLRDFDSFEKYIGVVDLFCGAGGASDPLLEAAARELDAFPAMMAVNHWDIAIKTHKVNHPYARHQCNDIEKVDPRRFYNRGDVAVIWCSPSCTHHSRALGGKPVKDQQRSHAWYVHEWADHIRPSIIMLENVAEFTEWGPCIQKLVKIKNKKTGVVTEELREFPDPDRKGESFDKWVAAMAAIGYRSEKRIICCANYGDPTSRTRLFMIFAQPGFKIDWAPFTHAKPEEAQELGLKPWVTARKIIDFSQRGELIFTRPRLLCANTIRRLDRGLRKFALKSFMVPKESGEGRVRSLDKPLKTVTCESRGEGLAEPYLVRQHGMSNAVSLDDPMPTAEAHANKHALAQPEMKCEEYIIRQHGTGGAVSVDEPLRTVEAGTCKHVLSTPVLDPVVLTTANTRSRVEGVKGVDSPIRTVTTKNHQAIGTPELNPILVPNFSERAGQEPRCHSVDHLLPTVTSHGAGALAQTSLEPVVVSTDHTSAIERAGVNSPDKPLTAVTTKARHGLESSVLIQCSHGGGDGGRVHDVDRPLPSITAKNNLGKGDHELAPVGEEFLVTYYGTGQPTSLEEPLDTVTTKSRFGHGRTEVGQLNMVLGQQSCSAARDAENDVLPTVATGGAIAAIDAIIRPIHDDDPDNIPDLGEYLASGLPILYHGQRKPPRFRHNGQVFELLVYYRMLTPRELARGQGFRDDYQFHGGTTAAVRQIGNAVPRNTALQLTSWMFRINKTKLLELYAKSFDPAAYLESLSAA